jgi:hypothetical protein
MKITHFLVILFSVFFSTSCQRKHTTKSFAKDEGVVTASTTNLWETYQRIYQMFPEISESERSVIERHYPSWWLASAGIECIHTNGQISIGMMINTNNPSGFVSAGHVTANQKKCLLNRHFLSERIGEPWKEANFEAMHPKNRENLITHTVFEILSKAELQYYPELKLEHFSFSPEIELNNPLEGIPVYGFDVSYGKMIPFEQNLLTHFVRKLGIKKAQFEITVSDKVTVLPNDGLISFCQSSEVRFPPAPSEQKVSDNNAKLIPSTPDKSVRSEALNRYLNLSREDQCRRRYAGATVKLETDFQHCMSPSPKNVRARSKQILVLNGETSVLFGRVLKAGKVELLTDLDSRSGCSGGPVFSLKTGEFIGVITSGASSAIVEGKIISGKSAYLGDNTVQVVSKETIEIYKNVVVPKW